MNGFLNLNKPAGFTSHDCVARVRKLLRTQKVGHGGTLDPAATGVLPIAIGQATRLLQYLPQAKTYRATIRFGLKTTTDDLEGEVLESAPASGLTLEKVQLCLPQFIGTIKQIPPSYSAIQVGGRRLYDLARSGEAVKAPMRTVQIDQIDQLEWRAGEFPELELEITCGAGTYIRSIARDLGNLVGTGGTLAALQRTRSSGFSLETSLTLEDLTHQIEAQTFQPVPPNLALRHMQVLYLTPEAANQWCNGQRIPWQAEPNLVENSPLYRVLDVADRFLGISQLINLNGTPHLAPKLVWTASS